MAIKRRLSSGDLKRPGPPASPAPLSGVPPAPWEAGGDLAVTVPRIGQVPETTVMGMSELG